MKGPSLRDLDRAIPPDHPRHHEYRRGCRRKRRHSYPNALHVARRLGGRVYECEFCGCCHVATARRHA